MLIAAPLSLRTAPRSAGIGSSDLATASFTSCSLPRPENDDNPAIVEETRQYIRDFDRLVAATGTAQELYDQMLALHTNRVNPGWALWSSARAAKK